MERSIREFEVPGLEIRSMKDARKETRGIYKECQAKSARALHTSDRTARRMILSALGSHVKGVSSPRRRNPPRTIVGNQWRKSDHARALKSGAGETVKKSACLPEESDI